MSIDYNNFLFRGSSLNNIYYIIVVIYSCYNNKIMLNSQRACSKYSLVNSQNINVYCLFQINKSFIYYYLYNREKNYMFKDNISKSFLFVFF